MEEAQIRVCFETHWQGFACNPADRLQPAIAHLREVLGDRTSESLARKGDTMRTAENGGVRLRPNRRGPSTTEGCLVIDLELNRSVHHWDERSRLLSPENGIGSAIEVVE
jgi:hypothetical protein